MEYKKQEEQYEMLLNNKTAVVKTAFTLVYPIVILVLICYIVYTLFYGKSSHSNQHVRIPETALKSQLRQQMTSTTLEFQ